MSHGAILKMKNSEMPSANKIKLLYGHAVGHAIELTDHQATRHGDAVAMGMTIEGAMACLLGIWNKKEWLAQTKLLKKFNLPILPVFKIRNPIDELIEKMRLYKKLVSPGYLGFVLPQKIGKAARREGDFITYVAQDKIHRLLKDAINYVRNNCDALSEKR